MSWEQSNVLNNTINGKLNRLNVVFFLKKIKILTINYFEKS